MSQATVELMNDIRRSYPDFKLLRKEDSLLMKIIHVFLLCITFGMQRRFMTDFVTTIGNTIYVPKGWDGWEETMRLIVLRHERVHMDQRRHYGPLLYSFIYLAWPFPLFLAYGRAVLEREAYRESMVAEYEYAKGKRAVLYLDAYKEWYISNFTGSAYAWMWPFRSQVEKWFMADRAIAIAEGKLRLQLQQESREGEVIQLKAKKSETIVPPPPDPPKPAA